MRGRERSLDVFREEALEHLEDFEKALLALEEDPGNIELVQVIFRSVHTLKGSSAMFGFDDLAALAHVLEDIFDLIRKGKMKPTREFIETALGAKDIMSAMAVGTEDNPEDCRLSVDSLISHLKRHMPEAGEEGPPPSDSPATQIPHVSGPEEEGAERTYIISFRPETDTFRRGINIWPILEDLRQLGRCETKARFEDIPPLVELAPLDCYLHWDITLTTQYGMEDIRDVFIFLDEGSDIIIEQVASVCSPAMDKTAVAPGGNCSAGPAGGSIRVPAEKLDMMVDLVGELVTVQARLKQAASVDEESEFYYISEDVERLTDALRENAMGLRMVPMNTTFNRFKRLVRDLSAELGKEVELITGGGETELDKNVIERLNDPLVHILRNCIGHGIESPEERAATGKSRRGMVYLSAEHVGGNVHIRIVDDGAGIDPQKIRARAVEKGLVAENQELSEREIYRLVFAAGFSTAESVSNVSGRGVGMDVVKKNIEALRGSIGMESEKGKGTTITLKIPLTLAIIDGLLVRVGEGNYVIPLSNVEECIEIRVEDLADGDNGLVEVRGSLVPYVNLREKFDIRGGVPPISQVVVTGNSGGRTGLVVDEVIGELQTVIKSLGTMYRNAEGLSGATILGDGSVALILDVSDLCQKAEIAVEASHLQERHSR